MPPPSPAHIPLLLQLYSGILFLKVQRINLGKAIVPVTTYGGRQNIRRMPATAPPATIRILPYQHLCVENAAYHESGRLETCTTDLNTDTGA